MDMKLGPHASMTTTQGWGRGGHKLRSNAHIDIDAELKPTRYFTARPLATIIIPSNDTIHKNCKLHTSIVKDLPRQTAV